MPTGKRVLARGSDGAESGTRKTVTESSDIPLVTSELVVGFDELMNKATVLNSLLDDTQAPATARWLPLVTWMRHHPEMTPWSVLIYRDRELVAAALLVRSVHRVGGLELETMGEAALPSWLPARDASSAALLAKSLAENLRALRPTWILRLRNLEIGDPVASATKREFPICSMNRGVSPRLDFGATEPLNTYLSRNSRSALAKARNRIRNAGLVSTMTWTSSKAEIDATVPEIVDLYQQRTIQLNQDVALLADPAYRCFFADMMHAYAEQGVVRLLTFRIAGELLSYAMCLQSGEVLLVYSNRMSPQGAKYSAGAITNAEVVRMAHSDPDIRCVDWGIGLQRYKMSGEAALHPYEDLDVWPSKPVRKLWVWARRVRSVKSRVSAQHLA